jgi:hypothetical protein
MGGFKPRIAAGGTVGVYAVLDGPLCVVTGRFHGRVHLRHCAAQSSATPCMSRGTLHIGTLHVGDRGEVVG